MDKNYVGFIDLLLVPFYFIVLVFIAARIRKKHRDNELYRKYYLTGFIFKLACAIFYGLLICFYYGYGDSLSYFKDAMNIKQQIHAGNETWDILFRPFKEVKIAYEANLAGSEGGWLVQRLSLLFSYIGFNRFFVVTIIFASLAYAGMFRMFITFCEIMPGWHKRLAIVVLFFPSVAVYGSGILKDTLCISAMGWMIYAVHRLFINKQDKLKFALIVAACIALLAIVKIYILAAFLLPFVLYLVMLLLKRIRSPFLRKIMFPVFLGLLTVTYISFADEIDSSLGTYAVEKLMDTVKEQQQAYQNLDESETGSNFNIGNIDPTLSGFFRKTPVGITATLFRPFLWEAGKVVMLFSALESLILFFFTLFVLFKCGVLNFFGILFRDPFVFLCIFYSLIFAALVGLSTPNFGTLARYRIPVLPFYVAGLMAALYISSVTKKTQRESIA